MKYGLVKTSLLYAGVATLVHQLAQGIINSFSYDIFERCISGEAARDSFFCQSGPQVSIDALAAALFVVVAIILFGAGRKAWKKDLFKFGLMGVVFFILAFLSWRMQLGLQNNFRHFSSPVFTGPAMLTDYLYILYLLLDTVIIGVILGKIAWIPEKLNSTAILAKDRNEPREDFAPKKTGSKSPSKSKTDRK